MKKYTLLVDMSNCNQCYACALACKDEHFGNDFPPYTLGIQEAGEDWIDMHIEERGSGSMVRAACWPEFCRHCDDPACANYFVTVPKAGDAVSKREDGIVLIDPLKAEGDRSLQGACPYGAVAWNEEKGLPQKCTLCAHLLDAGEAAPRCVEACPNGTLRFGDLADAGSEVSLLVKTVPELAGQGGVVRYYNNPGRFVAGSVYLSESEVAEGAEVLLLENGETVSAARTNGFGDFKFTRLPEGRQYEVRISYEGRAPLTLQADTAKDVCFEEITLA